MKDKILIKLSEWSKNRRIEQRALLTDFRVLGEGILSKKLNKIYVKF
jgi:hypothetical protein